MVGFDIQFELFWNDSLREIMSLPHIWTRKIHIFILMNVKDGLPTELHSPTSGRCPPTTLLSLVDNRHGMLLLAPRGREGCRWGQVSLSSVVS